MPLAKVSWKPNPALAVGKGATIQQFVASLGDDKLEIDVAPWGEGHLRVNGLEFAHIENRKSRHQAFLDLKKLAELHFNSKTASPLLRGSK
jgi:enoyl-[acyl-carrier protein] reductase I